MESWLSRISKRVQRTHLDADGSGTASALRVKKGDESSSRVITTLNAEAGFLTTEHSPGTDKRRGFSDQVLLFGMRTYQAFISDRRYRVPTLRLVNAASRAQAEAAAEQMFRESPQHAGIELWDGDQLILRRGVPAKPVG